MSAGGASLGQLGSPTDKGGGLETSALGPLAKWGEGWIGGCLELPISYSGWGAKGWSPRHRDFVLRRGRARDSAQGLWGMLFPRRL